MNTLKIAFANIYQGLIYEGKVGEKDVFSKYSPQTYVEQYGALNADIVCIAEVPLDDQAGHSQFVENLARSMGAVDYKVDVHDKSWIIEGKWYGNAIISKVPLVNYRSIQLPHPQLEIDGPDGSRRVLHDKTIQCAEIMVGNTAVKLFNLHYFAYHFFGRNLAEPELAPSKQALIKILGLGDDTPIVIVGDFNNGHDHLANAFPELFEDDKLTDAISFDSSQLDERYVGGKFQLDHLLYTTERFNVMNSAVIRDPSDHRGLYAELEMR